MFSLSVRYYDKFYAFKDYTVEAAKISQVVGERLGAGRRSLLDVACGTGKHLEALQAHFTVEGLDLNAELLGFASARLPGVALHQGDMERFDLGRSFDVVTCLFSSIGYLKTLERVARACACMAGHLNPGGVLLIEPWFTPRDWHPGMVHATLVEEPELKIVRMSTSICSGRISYFDFHYLIGTPQGTEHLGERHELGLFEQAEMRAALESAGLRVSYDPQGLTGRGLWIGEKASAA
jgi:SAM-dependent methyltransferase